MNKLLKALVRLCEAALDTLVVSYVAVLCACTVLPLLANGVAEAMGVTDKSSTVEWVGYWLVPYVFLAACLCVLFVAGARAFAKFVHGKANKAVKRVDERGVC